LHWCGLYGASEGRGGGRDVRWNDASSVAKASKS
jgi:hypothetical protein